MSPEEAAFSGLLSGSLSPEGSAGSPSFGYPALHRAAMMGHRPVLVLSELWGRLGRDSPRRPPLSALHSLAPVQARPGSATEPSRRSFWKPLLPFPSFLNPFPCLRKRKLTLPSPNALSLRAVASERCFPLGVPFFTPNPRPCTLP